MNRANLRIDIGRLMNRLDRLAQVGAIEGGGNARLALTDQDKDGRDLVIGWMKALGLTVTVDAIGNVFARRKGRKDLPPLMTGSHIDTVRTGGRYDGNYGVLAGLEVVEVLNQAGIETERPITVAFFTNEEGARFHPDMMGSLAYVGGMPLEEALAATDRDGKSVGEELHRIGYAGPEPVAKPSLHRFVELHIEQGPVLDREGVTIGAVDTLQGISWTEFTIKGTSNHAGTTPMRLRHDAGYVAAELTTFVRRLANEIGGDQVGTVGSVKLFPDLINVIPNKAVVTVDVRNTDEARLKEAERRVATFAEETAKAEGCTVEAKRLARFEPVIFDARMADLIERTAKGLGFSVRRMTSGAGHDAQMMQRVAPTAMIFVPSVDGISHNVREFTSPKDLEAGANVLLQVMLDLAG
ncbi:MAG: Zn-dependent hydrolase [Hyphomicrobiaceae bacterium]|nr:Zn-dependent hydrolase [Hyphomicrobiaceae bacterium]